MISGCEISHLGEFAVPGDAPTAFGTKLEKNLAWPSVAGSSGHNEAMASHVALLRGINVGGRNKVPMTDLREVVTSLGHTGVTTYIQSGNVLFSAADTDTAKVAAALESAIGERFGIWISVVVLSREELAQVLASNPYPDEPNPKLVHVVFLNAEPPKDLLDRIAAAESAAAAKGSRDTVQAAWPRPVPAYARRLRDQRAGPGRVPDHQPARETEDTGPGGHRQELGHGHQAAVPMREDTGRGEALKRAVLVTGASRGIGRAVAQAFAELGDQVAVHHRGSPCST